MKSVLISIKPKWCELIASDLIFYIELLPKSAFMKLMMHE